MTPAPVASPESLPGVVSVRRVAAASAVGTAIEFYDFYLYGTAAALIFGKVFFPSFSPTAGTLAALATFGIGFVARPLGALVFGHFGDRAGRKASLVASLLVMGLGTVAVGLIPSYGSIGVAAPVLLVVARFAQGIGLGAEWGGAVLLATEYAPEHKRGRYSSFPQLGPAVGFVASTGLFLLFTTTMSAHTFGTVGWRIPFLLSAVLVAVGGYIRVGIPETPVFRAARSAGQTTRVPVVDLVRSQPRVLVLATLSFILAHTVFYLVTTFCLAYGTNTLNIDRNALLLGTLVAAAVMGVGTWCFAAYSDRIGRRPLCLTAAVAAGAWAFPLFWLLSTRQPALVALAFSVALLTFAALYGPMGAFLPELFATRYRYTGASFAYSASGIVGGGISPLVATKLATIAGSWPVSVYLIGIALVGAIAVLLLPETRSTRLSEAAETPAGRAGAGTEHG